MSMLLLSTILIYIAAVLICISIFLNANKQMPFSYFEFIGFLFVIAVACNNANYSHNFGLLSLLIIASSIPLFATAFNLPAFVAKKDTKAQVPDEEFSNIPTKPEKNLFQKSRGLLITGISLFLTSGIIAFCGFILGKETYISFLISVPFSLLCMCIIALTKRKINKLDLLGAFLMFLSAGLVFGQILAVLTYSFTILNIIFAISGLIFILYCILAVFFENKYLKILLYFSLLLFATTLLFV